jgi:hypothetical protein
MIPDDLGSDQLERIQLELINRMQLLSSRLLITPPTVLLHPHDLGLDQLEQIQLELINRMQLLSSACINPEPLSESSLHQLHDDDDNHDHH